MCKMGFARSSTCCGQSLLGRLAVQIKLPLLPKRNKNQTNCLMCLWTIYKAPESLLQLSKEKFLTFLIFLSLSPSRAHFALEEKFARERRERERGKH